MMTDQGQFLKVTADRRLGALVHTEAPRTLWVRGLKAKPAGCQTVVKGRLNDGGREVALVDMDDSGKLEFFFDLSSTIDGILNEDYHSGLVPTLEMSLPFNYSRLHPAIKGMARSLRVGKRSAKNIEFPSAEGDYPADWLKTVGDQGRRKPWPDGHRTAMVVTYDVDTNWIFEHPSLLQQILRMQQRLGLPGAWYCVPQYSQGRAFEDGARMLLDQGCELGCHGYNHDARFALSTGKTFGQRLQAVKEFAQKWKIKGFRSEWLWRNPSFLDELSKIFLYDTSVPSASWTHTDHSNNGCGTCFPYITRGGMAEIPLTLYMDEWRWSLGQTVETFWQGQVQRAHSIVERGGLVVVTIHPQPHQSANQRSLASIESALKDISRIPEIWKTTPAKVAEWAKS